MTSMLRKPDRNGVDAAGGERRRIPVVMKNWEPLTPAELDAIPTVPSRPLRRDWFRWAACKPAAGAVAQRIAALDTNPGTTRWNVRPSLVMVLREVDEVVDRCGATWI